MSLNRLTSNSKLLLLIQIIEAELGGCSIGLDCMDKEHARVSACSIKKDHENNSWTLIYIPDEKPSDDILCHELMHIVLATEGFPGASVPVQWEKNSWFTETIGFLFNFLLHLEVWPLSKAFGFSEAERYDADIKNKLIPLVECAEFLGKERDYHAGIERIYYFMSALMSPAHDATKERLCVVIKKTYPEIYFDVQECCSLCKKYLPLAPDSLLSLGNILSKPLLLPDGCVRLEQLTENPRPDFRQVVLSKFFGALERHDK